jgi:DNA-directed RNA polymerase specialized sigma24 family protein
MSDDNFERHETPSEFLDHWNNSFRQTIRQPFDEYQALMSCVPFQEPLPSVVERLPAREAINDAIDALTPFEQWIFNSLVMERLSLRGLADQLQVPKTTIASIRDRIFAKLRTELEDNPVIQEVLERMSR